MTFFSLELAVVYRSAGMVDEEDAVALAYPGYTIIEAPCRIILCRYNDIGSASAQVSAFAVFCEDYKAISVFGSGNLVQSLMEFLLAPFIGNMIFAGIIIVKIEIRTEVQTGIVVVIAVASSIELVIESIAKHSSEGYYAECDDAQYYSPEWSLVLP